jgi:hypothetical protein
MDRLKAAPTSYTFQLGGPGIVRVWWNAYSPSTRSPPAASMASRRICIELLGAVFAKSIDS